MTKFLLTDDGLVSERYLIRLDRFNHPADPWFITYDRGTRAVDTRASASAVAHFLSNSPEVAP
ncbi:MAG TPA: hypothetical protein VGJ21_10290 [Terracidiphilus sp.]|jgi:hypothetical protein